MAWAMSRYSLSPRILIKSLIASKSENVKDGYHQVIATAKINYPLWYFKKIFDNLPPVLKELNETKYSYDTNAPANWPLTGLACHLFKVQFQEFDLWLPSAMSSRSFYERNLIHRPLEDEAVIWTVQPPTTCYRINLWALLSRRLIL